MTINNHNFDDNDLINVLMGYTVSFVGQIALFGVEVVKAAILGLVGGAAAYFGKFLIEKYVKRND